MGMFSMTSNFSPRPKLRVTCRSSTPSRPHEAQTSLDEIDRDDDERSAWSDLDEGLAFEVRPRLLINAAGPWIDLINNDMGLTTNFIGGTKGSHLVLDHQELRQAIGDHEFFFENKDGRIVLIFPLFDKVLVGTSDIPVENPDDVRCTEEEVDYFLGLVARVFPDIEVTRDQIVFRFSGVRPLAYSHAKTAGQISRDHEIRVLDGVWTGLEFPVYSLVGGKWTSFRAFSEQVTDKALEFLNLPRQKGTASLPIGGGRGYPKSPEDHKRTLEGLHAWPVYH